MEKSKEEEWGLMFKAEGLKLCIPNALNLLSFTLNLKHASFAVMLTEEEQAFIAYWETNRLKQKKTFNQLLVGLPIGFIFSLPILVNFFSGWYKRADMVGRSQFNPGILIAAVLAIAIFYAIFSKKHKWDMLEQKYTELKKKHDKFLSDTSSS